jgi:hypothetical protein
VRSGDGRYHKLLGLVLSHRKHGAGKRAIGPSDGLRRRIMSSRILGRFEGDSGRSGSRSSLADWSHTPFTPQIVSPGITILVQIGEHQQQVRFEQGLTKNAVTVEPVGEFEFKKIRRPLAAYNVVGVAGGDEQ